MTWSELDLEKKLWTVPDVRMKAGQTHEVPLSEPALAIVAALKTRTTKPTDLVFNSPRGGPFSDVALTRLLGRMKRSDITVHGFRSCFRDWAGDETGFDREEIEMALAHTIASSTERAYRRKRALEKRRALMTAWADYCTGKAVTERPSAKVVDDAANR